MTYSLNTLNASAAAKSPPRTGAARFGHEIGLMVGLLALVFWLLALLSYSAQDAAWSTSGARGGRLVANWAGRFGAWLADGSYFALGFSVWWCVAAGVRAWLSSLARWMRGGESAPGAVSPMRRRAMFWVGLVVLMCASTALEWSRLYRFEAFLPGHAGGVLGYITGPASVKWLGFTGSGLLAIVLAVLGAALVFRFSWGHVAEIVGGRIDALVQSRLAKREVAKDVAVGRKAAREREVVVLEERTESEVHHPQPIQIIEPVLVDVPQSTRVVKERQKPLFTEMPDSKLPLVDLLDGPLQRQETVAPETLEMTSRLIEKKLKDFGVEVRVVAAMPGPVITRYEIEPATGVKGSQIVGLAKDLARSLSLVSIRVAWQCKRYGTDNKVQPAAIREFRGALDQGFQHGIFFTTSSFTVEAVNEARRSGKVQITLVDIAGLIALLKSKGLGVTPLGNDVWKMDQAYFDKFKQAGHVHSANKKLFKAKIPAQ